MHNMMRITPKMKFPSCSVCNEPVELKTSKTDEKGKAVHEECYVVKVTGQQPAPSHVRSGLSS